MKFGFIAASLTLRTWRLQPWNYLVETAHCLQKLGHVVDFISTPEREGHASDQVAGIAVHHVADVRVTRLRRNAPLEQAIAAMGPDWLVWHVGLTSFLHLDLVGRFAVPSMGIFTSPVYSLAEVFRPGVGPLLLERELSLAHVAGLCVPATLLRRQLGPTGLRHLVTLSETTRHALLGRGLEPGQVTAIPPGLNQEWLQPLHEDEVASLRASLDFKPGDIVVAYAGSPARLRGIQTLIRAFNQARQGVPALKLLVLSRRHAGELVQAEQRVRALIASLRLETSVHFVSGFLERGQVRCHLAAADIIALPFELVPSDMPISLLEAMALGKPLITTRIACLPEMVGAEGGILIAPAQVAALAAALTRLAADPQLRSAYSASALVRARQWGAWDRAGSTWAQLVQLA